jgi:hypothetical protein
MAKRTNKYRITLEQLELANGELGNDEPIQLEFDNHDEVFSIIKRMLQKNLFSDNNETMVFTIGLKMFSEVMVKNRNNPLFQELLPAFRLFMEKLKQN